MDKDMLKNKSREIEKNAEILVEQISAFIFGHPELGGEEFKSSEFLTDLMLKEGFDVKYPYGSEKTAFRAEKKHGDGPVIALLAEYDALPGYGENGEPAHACGHNWIAAVSAGTAIVLGRMIEQLNGSVVLIGTPAEETYGGKIVMLEDGCFEDIDIVLQAHLEEYTDIIVPALAMDSLKFSFTGKAAHAASYPYEGINALDAVQLTFAGINALRQQLRSDIRVHGIVTEGGQAVNIIPDKAECALYVRGSSRSHVDSATERVMNCARGAALMTGAKLEISRPDPSFDDLIRIPTLVKLAESNMKSNGFDKVYRDDAPTPGSTDIGNVSYKVPTLYVEVALEGKAVFKVHDVEALRYADSKEAYSRMHQMIRSFSGIAIDLFLEPELIIQAKKELSEQLADLGGK